MVRSIAVKMQRQRKSSRKIVIGIFLAVFAICAAGCSRIQFINSKGTLPTMCTAHYPLAIGKDLVVGESSDELLRKVGKPNVAVKEDGDVYYFYFVQPFLLSGSSSKFLDVCTPQPVENSSMYYVTLDGTGKVESVVFWIAIGPDSREVKVPGADGLMLPATLYRPRGCGTSREPAIVLLHGWLPSWRGALHDPLLAVSFVLHDPLLAVRLIIHGQILGWRNKGGTETGMEWDAEILAEHGYVVLLPLMRGWSGGQNDCGLSQSADTARMIEWLASQPGVDHDRIGVMGASFGGQVALLTGAVTPRAKAVVSYAGVTDWVSANAQSAWYDWAPKECRADLETPSPVNVASRIKAPVLLIQGDADTTVPPEQAVEMEQALRKWGDSVQLYLVSGAGHDESTFIRPWLTSQQFLEANLGKPSCVQTVPTTSSSAQPTPSAPEDR
jgi:dienelactone hydrolase